MPRVTPRAGVEAMTRRLCQDLEVPERFWLTRREATTDEKLAAAVIVGIARRRWELGCEDMKDAIGMACPRYYVGKRLWEAMTIDERELWWQILQPQLEVAK